MGRAKKTKKFQMKKILNPKDARLTSEKQKNKESQKEEAAPLVRNVYVRGVG